MNIDEFRGQERAREWLLQGIDLDNLPGESTQWSEYEWASAINE